MRGRASHVIRPLRREILRFRLAALFAAQFFDLGTFSLMVDRHGVAAEANPIVAQGFADWGIALVIVAKLALVVLVGSIVVLLAGRPTRRAIEEIRDGEPDQNAEDELPFHVGP